MTRKTLKEIEDLVFRINQTAGTPLAPYAKDQETGQIKSQKGNFHLDFAYGGVALHEMLGDVGGVNDVFHGHYTKNAMHLLLWGFLQGMFYIQNKERESNET
jgi:hypothetical protein